MRRSPLDLETQTLNTDDNVPNRGGPVADKRYIIYTTEHEIVTYKHVIEAPSKKEAKRRVLEDIPSGDGSWVGTETTDKRISSCDLA